jgi:hypothetical protein
VPHRGRPGAFPDADLLGLSLDAIKAIAGSDAEKACYYDMDAQYLPELEPTAQHYEVAES